MPPAVFLIKLDESHIPVLYQWHSEEKQPEYHSCRPIENRSMSFSDFSEKILRRITSDNSMNFLVKDGESGEIVGQFFAFDYNPRNKSIEIGYYFPEINRGRGYGKAALSRLCDELFSTHDVHKIYATTGEFNQPSVAILRHCHFEQDGSNREHYWIGDRKYDQLVFSLLRRDWITKRGTVLSGENMNPPVLWNNTIYKQADSHSATVHRLLRHLEKKGITWVPRSLGIEDGIHVLTYIKGDSADEDSWLWEEPLLQTVARRIREFHDAGSDFAIRPEDQFFQTLDEPHEVICHNDLAPYNCIFRNSRFAGLIDFDVCAPGPRIWDLGYAAYRFIPLYPTEEINGHGPGPFDIAEMQDRIEVFLHGYAGTRTELHYRAEELIASAVRRLRTLADWTAGFAETSGKDELLSHAAMYRDHALWLSRNMLKKSSR